jgi:hypothetical protein
MASKYLKIKYNLPIIRTTEVDIKKSLQFNGKKTIAAN